MARPRPGRAGKILATWATAGERTGFLTRKPQASPRVIDGYHHRTGEDLARDRLEVEAAGVAIELTRQRAGGAAEPALALKADELEGMVTNLLLEPAA